MPRIPNVRPTSIYWLFDMRPETLVKWPVGLPFYCGKTILNPIDRFTKHRSDVRRYPVKAISQRLDACRKHVRIGIMEVVPASADWTEREKYWIYTLRTLYPDSINVTSGGQGAPGYIPSAETRAKRSASLKGKKRSAESCARIGKASANRSAATLAKIGAAFKGKRLSVEHRAKVSAAGRGRKHSDETRAKMSTFAKNRSPEIFAKISAKLKGRVFSAETLAKMSAGQRRRYGTLRDANA